MIEEIRRIRKELSDEYGNDPRRLFEELRRVQRELEASGTPIEREPERPTSRGSKAG